MLVTEEIWRVQNINFYAEDFNLKLHYWLRIFEDRPVSFCCFKGYKDSYI
jgi:hypothetical protein